ncbi:DUF1772 domain-containing protein [Antrihabitans sp. YC3-6]|uniref:DUF1772 domain-containing protein n=1 Tax=Antrihabitans stalagmiti TaxID=2799499 RepID=A0A934NRR1_9NOCA|nr:anthrone oxygenase family protein [Antrihabitans stalagmiti]MBJ8340228.1 DUF1772 domain-containing protein [Antrihabitans stalagmiti]
MQTIRTLTLIVATLTSGLLAGVYYAYATSVMPALNQVDNRAAVDVMQRINSVIVNPMFMLTFLGAPLATVGAVALVLGKDTRSLLAWVAAAAVLNIVATIITIALNVPLNDQLDAVGDPSRLGDPAAAWADFYSSWVNWNIVRAVAHTAAFGTLAWALVLLGRKSV